MYPLGVPVTYAAIVWRKRDLLNPRIHTVAMSGPGQGEETATTAQSVREPGVFSWARRTASKGQTKTDLSPEELEELEERVNARGENPKLAPSNFLWRYFGEGWSSIKSPPYWFVFGFSLLCDSRMESGEVHARFMFCDTSYVS